MRGISFVVAMVVLLVVAPACWAEVLVPMIQFGAAADFSDNFTVTSGGKYDSADDAGYGVGGCVTTTKTTSHNSMVYDVDKALGGVGEVFGQVTIDVDFKTSDGGIGIWTLEKYDGTIDRSYKTWTFFKPSADDDDSVKFYTARNMNDSGGVLRETYTADTTLAPNNSWMHLRLDVDNSADTSATLTLSVYDSQTLFDATTLKFQSSYTHLNGARSTGEVGVSLYYGASQFDNFAVYSLGDGPTVIPEPSTLALLATGLLGLLCYAWRRRK